MNTAERMKDEVRSTSITDFDCRTCGACCVEGGLVSVGPDDTTPRYLTASVRHRMGFASYEADLGIRCMKQDATGRCVALRGDVNGAVRCSVYERRPAVCRTFEPGSDACIEARQDYAVSEAVRRMKDRPTPAATGA